MRDVAMLALTREVAESNDRDARAVPTSVRSDWRRLVIVETTALIPCDEDERVTGVRGLEDRIDRLLDEGLTSRERSECGMLVHRRRCFDIDDVRQPLGRNILGEILVVVDHRRIVTELIVV